MTLPCITDARRFDVSAHLPFYIGDERVGWIRANDVALLARWPDVYSGERIRVEHWVVAQRQGQAAARNILGAGERYREVPFFWSAHYDVSINYVGHAERWDTVEVDGDPAKHDVAVRLIRDRKAEALATVFRDGESLEFEKELRVKGQE